IQGGQHVLGRFRLSATSAPAGGLVALTDPARAALLTPPNERTPEARLAIAADYLKVRAAQQIAALPPMAVVYASSPANQAARAAKLGAPQPRLIRLLKRGDLDKPGDPVNPGALSTIATLPARFTLTDPNNDSQRRAALASWIADPNNPLTWRSAVNRIWHYHFGKGLCDTPSDFGRMGGAPSHPELLDWLAVWFRDDAKGSLKALHRLIVTSNAWKQSSALPAPRTTLTAPAPNAGDSIPISTFPPVDPAPADPAAIDPDNRLLWHMSRSRMDADSFRDSILSISGRLDLTMGGPGVAHYNASPGPQATPVLDYANFNWDAPGATRRSIYRVVYRGIADPFLEVLDFPDMGMLSPTRGFSASALQSLTLFNNHFLLGQSQHLADRSAQGITDPAESVRRMVSLVLLRAPEPQELTDFTVLAQSAGLPAVARVLFNSNEFLFVD
ncbi:MAG: Planctomycete cytochrome, partial [Verrucomicrobiales bacterium]|nr:Planctomycete cytochrome [Verrucomicrobiales bacterium]